jgi:Zn-dependent protease/CBS domain-containing protein
VRAAGERLDVQRLRVLPVDPVADAAQPHEIGQVLLRARCPGHLGIVPRRAYSTSSNTPRYRCSDGAGAIVEVNPWSFIHTPSVTPSLTLGRIAGIRISINWSWLIVFALIVWSLAVAVFPSQNPGFSDGEYVALAVVAALLFFASLLLHELGHALQAQREGVEIEGINLWLFGGVAQFKDAFPSAGAEFRIAIAGPLVSLVLGVFFVLVSAFAALPDAIDGVFAWLGYTNLILLAFNLLPALPLDGGRVLRSALWHFRGDLQWATWVASGIGRGFGFLLIGLGIFMFIVEGAFSGAWLAFIGWFLLQAATAEARYVATQQALDGLKVRDLMSRQPVTVEADLSLGQFMDSVAWSQRYTTYPVLEQGRPIGLLAFRSVAAVPRDEWNTRRVREAMIPREKVPLLDADESAVDALAELSANEVNRGLVIDDGSLVGLLSITDLARALEVGRPTRSVKPTPERAP